jgi:hypothetical protein
MTANHLNGTAIALSEPECNAVQLISISQVKRIQGGR